MQPLEQENEEQARLKAEQAWLVELKAQGRKAQKHRDWEKQVLYLKESDEDARLDIFFEMLMKRLDLPAAGMEIEDFPEWEKEHAEALAFLYNEPDLPEKCGPAGALTKEVRKLTSSLMQPTVAVTPPQVAPLLRSEIETVLAEMAGLRSARNWLKGWFFAYGYISVCFFTLLVISCLDLFGLINWNQPLQSVTGPASDAAIIQALIYAGGAFGTLFVAIVLGLRRKRKEAELQQFQSELRERMAKLAQAVNPLRTGASPSCQLALPEAGKAGKRPLHDLNEAVGRWRSTVIREMVKDFFEQGLWMNDRLAERLKALLEEIQRPFPTSCRAEIKDLRDDQIESAFSVLTAVIASTIAAKVDLGSQSTLAQLIVSDTAPGVPMPSVVLEKLETAGALLKGDKLSEDTASCMNEVLKTLRS